MEEKRYTLSKAERLCSKKLIERLFAGGNKSFPAFPLRVVYMPLDIEDEGAEVSILVSVPKKRFKRAVKRNLVKRQVREAYRRNKYILLDALRQSENPKRMAAMKKRRKTQRGRKRWRSCPYPATPSRHRFPATLPSL